MFVADDIVMSPSCVVRDISSSACMFMPVRFMLLFAFRFMLPPALRLDSCASDVLEVEDWEVWEIVFET